MKWRMFWGPGPLPSGSTAIGTDGLNALIKMRSGIVVLGCGGIIRSRPQ